MADDLMDSEMTQFAQMQQQRVALQEGIMKVNNVCYDKCITGKPSSSLDSWTEGCITNCVGRFIDAQKFILNRLQQKASNMG
ncbi:mitochondrial import inner membrane translocase subunit Tim8 A-like [Watersipora subatra]|uniref:mitochondrial import inner membrane translocase subunit Tim8 A-like n=1 Tax=Watersipora subatra TaxID=2589382 RepID=UPI00355AE780